MGFATTLQTRMRRLNRWLILLLCLAAFCVSSPAQSNLLEPGHASATAPVVVFELNWPAADPSWYQISVDSAGPSSYRSRPHAESSEEPGDPYALNFIASQATRTRIFQLTQLLNNFKGNFETKNKVAQTGAKTLIYRSGETELKTSLNYSDNPQMNDLISIFQRMSTTFELGRKLDFDLRFDKLGLDRELKNLENLAKDGQVMELQVITPTLEKIANDSGIMNIARQRARRLLDYTRPVSAQR